MRVKIENVWYDSEKQPICIQISEEEKTQIGVISSKLGGKYAAFSDSIEWSLEEKSKWMKE